MGGAVIGMGKNDQTTRITFGPMEWVAIATLLITALCFLGGGVAVYRDHDRDITTLKADNQTLKAMVAELQADAKVVRSDVAEMKALLLRRAAAWPPNPTNDERMASIVHPSKDMGVGQ